MIILDTNVISELMRPRPEPRVVNWLRQQSWQDVFTTVVTEAELWFGVELLPAGRRRQDVSGRVRTTLTEDFAGRILEFDRSAAGEFGRLHAAHKRSGGQSSFADSVIAAIATAKRFAVVTRNTGDFTHTGLPLINPWTD